jgi:Glycosyltransferase family 87
MTRLILAARNGLLVTSLLLTALLGFSAARAYPTTDLFCFVTGARLLAAGEDPYDAEVWSTATAGIHPDYRGVPRPSPCPGRFGYPLWTALALVPLTWLDPGLVGIVWEIVLFGAAGAGVLFLARAAALSTPLWLALTVALSQPFWLTVLNAQFGGILLGALGAATLLGIRRRDLAAGLSLGVGWLKPHVTLLALVAIPMAAARSGRTAMAAAVAGVLVGATAASLALRPSWPIEYLTEILQNRTTQTLASTSLVGLSSALVGSALPGLLAVIAAVVAAGALLRGTSLRGIEAMAVAVTTTLVVTPYVGSHDQLLLAPAWARVLASPGRFAVLGAIVLAVALPWASYALRNVIGGSEGLSGLVPAITLITLAIVIRRDPLREDPSGAPS